MRKEEYNRIRSRMAGDLNNIAFSINDELECYGEHFTKEERRKLNALIKKLTELALTLP